MTQSTKILVVDDNPVIRLGVTYLLASEGHEVLEASSGGEALEVLRANRPDLVLLDVVLPDFNGVELCRRIRSNPQLAGIFVVLLSDKETSPDRQVNGLDAGADAYITRPIGNQELRARVQSLLRIRQAEAALRQTHAELERRVEERTRELVDANAALRTLSRRLVEVQESERRFIARELHDEMGQMLTGLKLSLELTSRAAPASVRPALADAIRTIDELMGRVRQLSLDLRPHILDDLGLLIALEWHFKRFSKQTAIAVDFQHPALAERLPTQLETAVFRVAQEALTNIARHARVRQATVRLWQQAGVIGVQIADQGAGFDPASVLAQRNSSGVCGIRERAEMLGGRFQLESSPGQGTRITVELPLSEAETHPPTPTPPAPRAAL